MKELAFSSIEYRNAWIKACAKQWTKAKRKKMVVYLVRVILRSYDDCQVRVTISFDTCPRTGFFVLSQTQEVNCISNQTRLPSPFTGDYYLLRDVQTPRKDRKWDKERRQALCANERLMGRKTLVPQLDWPGFLVAIENEQKQHPLDTGPTTPLLCAFYC